MTNVTFTAESERSGRTNLETRCENESTGSAGAEGLFFFCEKLWFFGGFFFLSDMAYSPRVDNKTHCSTIQMCFSHTTLCSGFCLRAELWFRAGQAACALQGRRDLAEVLSPCYVNPVAAKREGTTQRHTQTARRDRQLASNQGRLRRFSQVATPHMWDTGRKPEAFIDEAFVSDRTGKPCTHKFM